MHISFRDIYIYDRAKSTIIYTVYIIAVLASIKIFRTGSQPAAGDEANKCIAFNRTCSYPTFRWIKDNIIVRIILCLQVSGKVWERGYVHIYILIQKKPP